jgi:hypothetical protein
MTRNSRIFDGARERDRSRKEDGGFHLADEASEQLLKVVLGSRCSSPPVLRLR